MQRNKTFWQHIQNILFKVYIQLTNQAYIKLTFSCFLTLVLFYLVVVRSISQQASKGDGVGNAAQIDKEHGRDGLKVETLVEITE